MKENKSEAPNTDNKRYGHKTQLLDTGKVTSGVITVFFKEFFEAICVLFNLLKTKYNERTNRKN